MSWTIVPCPQSADKGICIQNRFFLQIWIYGGLEAHQGHCIMVLMVLPISPYRYYVLDLDEIASQMRLAMTGI